MPLRALLYRRPTEPNAIEVVFDRSIYLVRLRRHRQARRYTLRIQAATREVMLTMPPRGSLREAREFAEKHGGWIAARLVPAARGGAVRARHGAAAARPGPSHRPPPRPARHGVDRARRGWRAASVRRRRRAACRAPRRRFPPPRGQARPRSGGARYAERARRDAATRDDPRSVEPLGLVLDHRGAVVLVAADPGAAPRARLSGGARGRASDRDEPLGPVLAAARAHVPGHGIAPRSGSTCTAPTCIATACARTIPPPSACAVAPIMLCSRLRNRPVARQRRRIALQRRRPMLRPDTLALTAAARAVDRSRAAGDGPLSAVAARDRPPARRRRCRGPVHHLGLPDRIRGRPDRLWPDLRPARPQAGL